MINKKKRCNWLTDDHLYIDYHDKEWGVPIYDDNKLFEYLILEGAQAGLSWITVLKKRESYRKAYDSFAVKKVAAYGSDKEAELLNNEGIIRNKLKIRASILNAKCVIKIQEEYRSLSNYLWSYVDNKSVNNLYISLKDIPVTTDISDKISKDLKKRGLKFVGSTIIYAFMQAVGMVNDHIVDCFRYEEVEKLVKKNFAGDTTKKKLH